MVGRNSSRKEEQRRVAVALWHVAEDLIISAILFDDVDDMLEWWICFARLRSVPIVSAPNSRSKLGQLGWFDVRRKRCERAVQLPERVVTTVIRYVHIRCWELWIRARAFTFRIQDEQRVSSQ